jgi:hypothetical protein
VIQRGQVFKLKAKGVDGQPLRAYRYRLEGRGSVRPQVGGFASRAEAQRALGKALERLGPGGRAAAMTLAELVDQYLGMLWVPKTPFRLQISRFGPSDQVWRLTRPASVKSQSVAPFASTRFGADGVAVVAASVVCEHRE